jgi:hypothetical protein
MSRQKQSQELPPIAVKDSILKNMNQDELASSQKPSGHGVGTRAAAGSMIQQAIRQSARLTTPPSSEPSDNSSSSSSDVSSETSSESDGRRRSRRKRRKSSKKSKKSKKRESQKTLLKPIPPQEYDGAQDAQAFYRFVRQSSAYLKAGRVHEDEKILYLSYRLKGKALNFHEREVAGNESKWTLEDFFWGLFEYCFPVDFRSRQRDKLNRCFQNQKSISEHTAEWLQIYNMIGLEDNQEKVAKFRRSLNADISQKMFREIWTQK